MASSTASGVVFDAIGITSSSPLQRRAYQLELEHRRSLGIISPSTTVLAISDIDGLRVGSGGATFAALYHLSLHLCQSAGYATINLPYLRDKRMLILHSGGDSQRIPIFSVRGKAFSPLPVLGGSSSGTHLMTPIDFLLQQCTEMCSVACPPGGMLVAATDMLLVINSPYKWVAAQTAGQPPLPNGQIGLPLTQTQQNVVGIGIVCDDEYGLKHGVYCLDPSVDFTAHSLVQQPITNILQKASLSQLQQEHAIRHKKVMLDSGVIYFASEPTLSLLSLYTSPVFKPFIDNTAAVDSYKPFRFELYTDLILPMNPAYQGQLERYLAEPPPEPKMDLQLLRLGRTLLWECLSLYRMTVICEPDNVFTHVGSTAEYQYALTHQTVLNQAFKLQPSVHYSCDTNARHELIPERSICMLNSVLSGSTVLGDNAVVEGCTLTDCIIGSQCLVSGVRSNDLQLHLDDGIVCQQQALSAVRLQTNPRLKSLIQLNPHLHNATELHVLTLFGLRDDIKGPITSSKATLCNHSWQWLTDVWQNDANLAFVIDDVWDAALPVTARSLWNARLYPVFNPQRVTAHSPARLTHWLQRVTANKGQHRPSASVLHEWRQSPRVSLQEISQFADAEAEIRWRQQCTQLVDIHTIKATLLSNESLPIMHIVKRLPEAYKLQLLPTLDSVATNANDSIVARTLCTIADVLSTLFDASRYKRSGLERAITLPAEWQRAVNQLEHSPVLVNRVTAIQQLAALRDSELALYSGELAMKVARFYDIAWSALIRRQTNTVQQFIRFTRTAPPQLNQIVECYGPVRLDLMGGWSDTPPITSELAGGGAVCNVAVLIDGRHPIGATGRLLSTAGSAGHGLQTIAPLLVLRTIDRTDPTQPKEQRLDISTLAELTDYNQPTAKAALLKAVLVALNVVSFQQPALPLQQQLQQALANQHSVAPAAAQNAAGIRGLELCVWSELPGGTGLGVSSILAVHAVSALARLLGRQYDHDSVVHLVLLVEQLLSTGGGWQDNVGGLFGGFKLAASNGRLPLRVQTRQLQVSPQFIETFNNHTLVIHTGQSRLAKNLLQTVLRCWYSREQVIVDTVSALPADAKQLALLLESASPDIAQVGAFVSQFWAYKKIMATPPGLNTALTSAHPAAPAVMEEAPVEPVHVTRLLDALQPYISGASLLGAGGGGYCLIVTKQPLAQSLATIQLVIDHLNNQRRAAHATITSQISPTATPRSESSQHLQLLAMTYPSADYVIHRCTVDVQGMQSKVEDVAAGSAAFIESNVN